MAMVNRKTILLNTGDWGGYRLAERSDLAPGARLFMSMVRDDGRNRAPYPIPLVLERNPIRWSKQFRQLYVYYSTQGCEGCFVPLKDFIGEEVEADQCGPFLTTLYLVKL